MVTLSAASEFFRYLWTVCSDAVVGGILGAFVVFYIWLLRQ